MRISDCRHPSRYVCIPRISPSKFLNDKRIGPYPALMEAWGVSWVVKYVETDPARELFEFADYDSEISQKYLESVQVLLASGIRLICIAGWQDEVVPVGLNVAGPFFDGIF